MGKYAEEILVRRGVGGGWKGGGDNSWINVKECVWILQHTIKIVGTKQISSQINDPYEQLSTAEGFCEFA